MRHSGGGTSSAGGHSGDGIDPNMLRTNAPSARETRGNGKGRTPPRSPSCVLITGGAGFIGTNVAARYLSRGRPVTILDNLSRAGVEENLEWLKGTYGDRIRFIKADVRDREPLREVVAEAERVFHFAAQVAVTTSLEDPRTDFATNALGTLNILEACRSLDVPPPLLFTSTNKVYGDLANLRIRRDGDKYLPIEEGIRRVGISESSPLDFHSPYGCSKGAADQYVRDYARCYGLPTVVFRMSCIYGPHQCGTEDQGWVAHFAKELLADREVTFYGDGRQVRDLLFVEDLVDAMELATDHVEVTAGQAFNIGGGPENAVSVREVVTTLGARIGRPPRVRHDAWRQGDQRYYVSDIRAFSRDTGWRPRVSVRQGIDRLYDWLAKQVLPTEESALA